MQIFYVYEHWRPDRDVCFYVGKGKGKRAYIFNRGQHYNRIVAKLSRLGMCVEVRLVASALDEDQAFALEKERIAFWRSAGVELANRTNGGDGAAGLSLSVATRKKLSALAIGRRPSEETRAKMSKARIGRKASLETRAKMSASLKKTYRSKELREKIGAIHRGKVYSEETCEEIRAARMRQVMPPRTKEHIEKLAASHRGRKRPEETKARLRAAWVRRRERAVVPGFA